MVAHHIEVVGLGLLGIRLCFAMIVTDLPHNIVCAIFTYGGFLAPDDTILS